MQYPTIAQKIIQLREADFALRDQLIASGQLGDGYNEEMAALHRKNAEILNDIIDNIGYPTIELVGKAASDAAWLVIQHSIGKPSFMRKCAGLLAQAVTEHQASPLNLAYLTDRIAVMEGKPQRYGTQFDWDENGDLSPKKFDDSDEVDKRRTALGLNTLAEQTEVMRLRVEQEQQSSPADAASRRAEMDEWRKAVGWIA